MSAETLGSNEPLHRPGIFRRVVEHVVDWKIRADKPQFDFLMGPTADLAEGGDMLQAFYSQPTLETDKSTGSERTQG